MTNDWKYCIVQMPRSCFCLPCFTRYTGPTGTDHNETDSSVFPMTKEKKITQWYSQNWPLAVASSRTKFTALPFRTKLWVAAEKNTPRDFDPWKKEMWQLGKSALLVSLGVIQVHCYLWSCPILCSPHCGWVMGGSQWPLQDASSVPGNVGTQGKCGCDCILSQPGQPPVPVCGRGVQAVQCHRTVCRCWGWRRPLVLVAPPGAWAAAAASKPPVDASPVGCRDTGQSPGAPAASPHTLTAASTHTGRKR